jgi:hypothetical protein
MVTLHLLMVCLVVSVLWVILLLHLILLCKFLDVWRLKEVIAQLTHSISCLPLVVSIRLMAFIHDGGIVNLLLILILVWMIVLHLVLIVDIIVLLHVLLRNLLIGLILVLLISVLMIVLILLSLQILHLQFRLHGLRET